MSSQKDLSTAAGTDLVSGGDVARALRISRQRLSQLREREEFPSPVQRAGTTYLWRWSEVEGWLQSRKGERPEFEATLEHRLQQVERIGYRVRVEEAPQHHRRGELPVPGDGWVASISMRGWGSIGSEGEHDTPESAAWDTLDRFYDRSDRDTEHGARDLDARVWELARHGWRWPHDGLTAISSAAREHVFELVSQNGHRVTGRGVTPGEARRQAIELAEEFMLADRGGARA